jgi:hypothetical protein
MLKYYVENDHSTIIIETFFMQVQQIIKQAATKRDYHQKRQASMNQRQILFFPESILRKYGDIFFNGICSTYLKK